MQANPNPIQLENHRAYKTYIQLQRALIDAATNYLKTSGKQDRNHAKSALQRLTTLPVINTLQELRNHLSGEAAIHRIASDMINCRNFSVSSSIVGSLAHEVMTAITTIDGVTTEETTSQIFAAKRSFKIDYPGFSGFRLSMTNQTQALLRQGSLALGISPIRGVDDLQAVSSRPSAGARSQKSTHTLSHCVKTGSLFRPALVVGATYYTGTKQVNDGKNHGRAESVVNRSFKIDYPGLSGVRPGMTNQTQALLRQGSLALGIPPICSLDILEAVNSVSSAGNSDSNGDGDGDGDANELNSSARQSTPSHG